MTGQPSKQRIKDVLERVAAGETDATEDAAETAFMAQGVDGKDAAATGEDAQDEAEERPASEEGGDEEKVSKKRKRRASIDSSSSTSNSSTSSGSSASSSSKLKVKPQKKPEAKAKAKAKAKNSAKDPRGRGRGRGRGRARGADVVAEDSNAHAKSSAAAASSSSAVPAKVGKTGARFQGTTLRNRGSPLRLGNSVCSDLIPGPSPLILTAEEAKHPILDRQDTSGVTIAKRLRTKSSL